MFRYSVRSVLQSKNGNELIIVFFSVHFFCLSSGFFSTKFWSTTSCVLQLTADKSSHYCKMSREGKICVCKWVISGPVGDANCNRLHFIVPNPILCITSHYLYLSRISNIAKTKQLRLANIRWNKTSRPLSLSVEEFAFPSMTSLLSLVGCHLMTTISESREEKEACCE